MKNLITAAACLMVLMAISVQFTHSQVLHMRLTAADQAVSVFGQNVRQEGCVSQTSQKKLKQELASLFQCTEEDITVEGNTVPVFRGNVISFTVSTTVDNVIAAAPFWNLRQGNNQFEYKVCRNVTSEYTGREL